MSLSRREFLARSGATGVAIAVAGSLDALFMTSAAEATPVGEALGYGPLIPDPAGLLDLPAGFSYKILSVETLAPTSSLYRAIAGRIPNPSIFTASRLSDGGPVPGRHDGQATFPAGGGRVRLVRNHEQSTSGTKPVAPAELVFDPKAWGGTTTLEVDADGDLIGHRVSLAGTSTNCAGGRTPWGTWLTCEETEARKGATLEKDHGWVFEVDPADPANNLHPVPLTAMGRFPHEAVAVDPATSIAYLTEDAARPFGLLYRFTPADRTGGYGSYRAGGTLEAMHAVGVPQDDLATVQKVGAAFRVEWVPVPDPLATTTSTRKQFNHPAYVESGATVPARTDAATVTRSQKLEGAWWGEGAAYFVASFAHPEQGAAAEHVGQVWRYDVTLGTIRLELIFRPGETRFDSPDNITVSPYGGGVVLAEDGDGEQHLVAVAQNGRPFAFARNALNIADPPDPAAPEPPAEYSEFAGVTFSADGETLFANSQTPGITYAITGPWRHINPRPAAT
ncbi:MAG TPA: alkaline phosphatase PhoX [Mycobacteriales bacterium]